MKKKRLLLLTLVLSVTLVGGIITTVISNKNDSQKPLLAQSLPKSEVNPDARKVPEVNKIKSKVLIGYVQDFRDPDVVNYPDLTHVIFSFAHPTKDGGILLNGDWALKNLRTTVKNAKKTNTKVMLAVGGWYHIQGGESYPYFKAAISNPSSRNKLVSELIGLVDREKLDGIDIDFEHPRSSSDAANLSAFMKQLGTELHSRKKELSVAVYSKIHAVTLTEIGFVQYDPAMFQYVDHVNIMAYDGQWDDGYHAANLSPYPFTEKIVNYWTQLFTSHHLSTEKLVLGVPFYAQPEDPKIKQVSFAAIVHQNPADGSKDTVKMNGTTYYYNGENTMKRKTKLALDHNFGGMMIWEVGLDATGKQSLTGKIFTAMKDSSKDPVKYYAVKK